MASEFTETFLRDAAEILETLKSGATDVARALHSLKSGASFLGWEDLEIQTHTMEDALTAPDGAEVDWGKAALILERIIRKRITAFESGSRTKQGAGRAVRFTDLERRVLEESRQRREHFYRLTCRIDPSEPLPYSRAYLLSSKLETGMTLIKSEPPMNHPEADFARPTFWFTTDTQESEIFMAVNVDLVEIVELIQLKYRDILETGEVDVTDSLQSEANEDSTLIVDRTQYSEAMQISEELAWRLERRPGTVEANLSAELQRSLETLAYRPFEPMLTDISNAVPRLAERRGLKAHFEWTVDSGGLDAATLESLSEILKQLIRNSLRHGIEMPENRRASGKNEAGVMNLRVERSGRAYKFHYEDDGRGIDEDAVIERAEREGLIGNPENPDLLEILCTSGFSMADKTDLDGGRGMGLDLVRHMIMSEFGSDLELDNSAGQGLSIRWILPEKHMRRPYLVFASDGRSWAIPADSVHRRGVMEPGRVNASGQAYSIGGGLIPIVGPMGLRPPGTIMPYFLEIHHRGRRAALLVDDLLSEEPWGPGELVPADPAGPWCRSLKDLREGIPILSPTLVYAAETG